MGRVVLLLLPVYVTFFWAVVLMLDRHHSNAARLFLARIMVAGFVVYLSHFFFFTSQFKVYGYLDPFYTLASLSMHPLYFIYVLMLTRGGGFSLSKHLKYLIAPGVIFLCLILAFLFLDDQVREHYYSKVLTGKEPAMKGEYFIYGVYIAGRALFIIQAILYLYLVNREVTEHNRIILDYYSDAEERSLGWVKVFNYSYFLTSGAGVVLALLGRERFFENDIPLLFPSIIFSFLLFIIGYLGSRQKKVNVDIPDLANCVGEISEVTFTEGARMHLADDLRKLFEKDEFYLNKDFKIWDVCSLLGTNRTYVSRVINQEFGVNFTTFVNNYRVDHAKKLIEENRRLSVDEIADQSGFGSVNSLYRAFESWEGVSLGTFRKHKK
ncbi:MAG: helix-turn-helix domain-containing protein [Bacteroidales bacterium]|nr:helix-turn-helix domain-containing protein [Bacteroidales bacterium]